MKLMNGNVMETSEMAKYHKCIRCGKRVSANRVDLYAPDPYEWDVYENDTKVWECEKCRESSVNEI